MRQCGFLYKIFFIKILSCIFAYYVFASFSQLGDSQQYINATLDLSLNRLTDRTYLTENFFAFLAMFVGRGLSIHLATSLLVAFSIWYVFKPYAKSLPLVFWLVMAMPLFAVWTSVVGKEALSFSAFLIIIKWVADVIITRRGNNMQLLLAILVAAVLRPHYLLAYFMVVILIYVFLYKRDVKLVAGKHLSEGVYLSFILLATTILLAITFKYYSLWASSLDYLMKTSESYFLSYDGNTNRESIPWTTLDDFLLNMYWGVPASIIGPTPMEALNKPLLIPFFIEGLISFLLIPYFFIMLMDVGRRRPDVRFFLYNVFLPAIFIALLIHYPFGIFNPGTATRYKQSLTPLFYFLPILIMSAANAGKKVVVIEKP